MLASCPSCGRSNRLPAARLDDRARCAGCKVTLLPFDRPFDVGDAATFDEIVQSSPLPVVVDFWAPWCGPCRTAAPGVTRLASSSSGRVVVLKVDTDKVPEIANRYAIRSIPTFIRFDRGRETKRTSGALSPANLAQALGLPWGETQPHA